MKHLLNAVAISVLAGCNQTTTPEQARLNLERHMEFVSKDRPATETVTETVIVQPIYKVSVSPVTPVKVEEDRQPSYKRPIMRDLRIKPPRPVFTQEQMKPSINQPKFCKGQCEGDNTQWTLEVTETPSGPHEGCDSGCAFAAAPGGGGTWYFWQ